MIIGCSRGSEKTIAFVIGREENCLLTNRIEKIENLFQCIFLKNKEGKVCALIKVSEPFRFLFPFSFFLIEQFLG